MPDQSHVGRRYGPSRRVLEDGPAARFGAVLESRPPATEVAPTLSAVYCLFPILSELFADSGVGLSLDGLIHTSQSFEWPEPARSGDEIEATGEITSVQSRRGMVFLGLAVRATNQRGATVCTGTSMLVARLVARGAG